MPNCFDLTGRVAVVIGATSGIGRAIAIGLAEHGADVVPSGRRSDGVDEVCQAIEALGRRTIRTTVDTRSRTALEGLRDSVTTALGHVDILVNAAGVTQRKSTATVTDGDWTGLLDTNLNAVLRSCQTFYPNLKASEHARIINIASLGSFVAFHEVAGYCASKSAV